ncbi:hypothetical protein CPT_Madawaska_028 [Staphylococcus phage Madawaska]|nr:hypothetical protein CPT_Madawaska_028 [Staphylococcus phage Madawaska]
MKNKINLFDWYIYKNGMSTILPLLFNVILSSTLVTLFILILSINTKLALLSLLIFIPMIITSIFINIIFFNNNIMTEYGLINNSFKVKDKYYSFWHIELNEDDEVFKEAFNNFKDRHEWIIEEKNVKNLSEILLRGSFIRDTKILEPVMRENNRKHWKNNIDTNRLLTYREFLKYKKNKKKFEESKKLEKEIKEFQDYYNLNTKGEIKK